RRDRPHQRRPDRDDRNDQNEAEAEDQCMARQRDGQLPPANAEPVDDLPRLAPKPPVAQDRPGGPVGDHKMADSCVGQPQDIGLSLRQNSNNPCNVHGAFPPSPDERQPFWPVAKTRGRRLATTRRNGPSSTLTQAVGGASSRYSASIRRRRSSVRSSQLAISRCSESACAPPPSGPSPSSVATPMAAVKLPSLPPPVLVSVSGKPTSPASRCASWARRMVPALRSIGGRSTPPLTRRRAPASFGCRSLMAPTTRSASEARAKRTSISARACAATTLGRVPPSITPTLMVVPAAGSLSALRASTCCASSSIALIPFSGSTPAWA